MRLNKSSITATLLIVISLIPNGITFFQFFNSGGMGWPMVWKNEAVAWSAVFSIFALLGLLLAYKNRKQAPKSSILIMLFAVLIIAMSMFELFHRGVGPSSKADNEELQLLSYWSSNWWN